MNVLAAGTLPGPEAWSGRLTGYTRNMLTADHLLLPLTSGPSALINQ
jgi:hypothetical protein